MTRGPEQDEASPGGAHGAPLDARPRTEKRNTRAIVTSVVYFFFLPRQPLVSFHNQRSVAILDCPLPQRTKSADQRSNKGRAEGVEGIVTSRRRPSKRAGSFIFTMNSMKIISAPYSFLTCRPIVLTDRIVKQPTGYEKVRHRTQSPSPPNTQNRLRTMFFFFNSTSDVIS